MSKNLVRLLFVFLTLHITSCSENKQAVETTKNIKVSVRMKWFFAGTMTGWFSGRGKNFFSNYGIDLDINPGGPGNNSVKLVAAGNDLFGVAGADELLMARANGIPVVAVGVLFKDSPIGFISKKSKNIYSPSDWNKKSIEVSYGSNAEVQFRALVKKFSVKRFTEVPYTFNLTPFIENKVDVSVAYVMDQVVTLRRMGILIDVLQAKDFGVNPYGDVIIATENTVKTKPELVKKFLSATKQSLIWAIENQDSAVNYLTHNVKELKFENEREVWKSTIPFIIPDYSISKILHMELNRWQETLNMLEEFNFVKEKISVDKSYKNILNNF